MSIEFKVDNNFTPVPPDVLRLNFGLITVVSPFTTRIAELYDGNTLLGTAMTSSFGGHTGLLNLDPSNSWRTADSVWNFDSPGIADFTTILDGSIIGRIDFKIATGTVDIPLEQVNLNFVKATGAAQGIVVGPAPKINTRLPSGSTTGRSDARKPLPSVFSPMYRPSRRTTQLTAPITAADSPRPSRCSMTATLCGRVQLNPW